MKSRTSITRPIPTTILVLAAVLSQGQLAVAQSADRAAANPFEGRWWDSPRVQQRLQLSREQVRAIESLSFESGKRLIDLRAALERARLEMTQLLQDDTLDNPAIDRSIEALVAAQGAMFREETVTRAGIAKILSATQRDEILRWFESRPLLRRMRDSRLK
jgi:Spy/CpxP family protein refolding chaperone